jgi:1-acyl-sn-glycerol-3-phosphate acyltransferase
MVYPITRRILFPLVSLFMKSVEGLERLPLDRPVIYAANHLGMFDPVFLGTIVVRKTRRNVRFLVDPTKKYWRFIGRFTQWWTHAIPVDHGRHEAFFNTIRNDVRQGDSIGIFPEGETAQRGHLLPPKPGVIRIARDTGAPIIPVGLIHTELPLIVALLRRFRGPEGITLRFGQPFYVPKDADEESFPGYLNTLMEDISQLSGLPVSPSSPA